MGATTITPSIRSYDPDQLSAAAAEQIARNIAEVIAERGTCRLGLAGGGTPRPVYQTLAGRPLADQLAWDRLHLYWGDERCVPPDHESSNYRMVSAALLDRVSVPRHNIHRIEGERSPDDAARAYIDVLGDQPLDILLLGMGGDGHTASLFPDTADLSHTGPRVIATKSPVPPHDRVSLAMRAINEAGAVYLLVSGAGKADRLAQVFGQIESGAPVLPAARVQPSSGRLFWLVDSQAAKSIAGRSSTDRPSPTKGATS
ncbi:MAG: 6-phosphogluconolactonase [Proteobacteria bacterium]|nr:6-phosphogluconolactonase [Pseudomonadota bacterium]